MDDSNHVVLVLPGGGLRGLVQASFLAEAEAQVGPLNRVVHLAVGASVGLITAATMAAGFPMWKLAELEAKNATNYFPTLWLTRLKNLLTRKGIYDYKKIIADVVANGFDLRYGDLPVKTMGVAACVNDGVSHYFKSYDVADADRRLTDVLSYAFAAPWYFGTKNSPAEQLTYEDGGVGLSNNPVLAAFFEVLALGWTKNTTIIVVGTGKYAVDQIVPYEETSTAGVASQAKGALRFGSSEAEVVAQRQVDFLDSLMPGITVKVFNPIIPDGSRTLGNPDYVSAYIAAGKAEAVGVDFRALFGAP